MADDNGPMTPGQKAQIEALHADQERLLAERVALLRQFFLNATDDQMRIMADDLMVIARALIEATQRAQAVAANDGEETE